MTPEPNIALALKYTHTQTLKSMCPPPALPKAKYLHNPSIMHEAPQAKPIVLCHFKPLIALRGGEARGSFLRSHERGHTGISFPRILKVWSWAQIGNEDAQIRNEKLSLSLRPFALFLFTLSSTWLSNNHTSPTKAITVYKVFFEICNILYKLTCLLC